MLPASISTLNSTDRLMVTYNFYDIDAVNRAHRRRLNAVGRGTNLDNRDHTLSIYRKLRY